MVKRSSGQYCWYLGDDDVIISGGIDFVIKCLISDNYDVVTIEAKPITVDCRYLTKDSYLSESKIEVGDFNEFYFNNYCQGGFSVLIFNRELWLNCVDTENYLKYWLYYETVLKMLVATKKKMLYIKQPGILTGQDCRWAENGTEIFTFTNSNILLKKMIGFGFDKKRIESSLNNNVKNVFIILLRAKGHGLKCSLSNWQYIKNNLSGISKFNLILLFLLFIIPNSAIIFIRDARKFFYKKINRTL